MNHRTTEMREGGVSDHVLVCTNTRDSEYPCCADASGQDVLEEVKAWLREREVYWSTVRVAETSCLGLCSADGTALVIHPRNRWYSDVRPDDVPDVLRTEFGAGGKRLGLGPKPAGD